jgi:protein-tyrosine phosphatase
MHAPKAGPRSVLALVALIALALIALAQTPEMAWARAPAVASAPSRVLPLEGGQNFRDLGGYRTVDGRTVKWRVLFRSGAMDTLTAGDFETLRGLGIVTVCDLRSTRERAQHPVSWPAGYTPKVLAADYDADPGPLAKVLGDPTTSGEAARAAFASLYAELPYRFAGQYRVMFHELLAGHVPLAFNCSGGKDRTGVGAALLLSALGVPREKVMEDFLLSNRTMDVAKEVAKTPGRWAKFKPEAVQAIMGVDRSYLEAAFSAIDQRSGGLKGYYRRELGLSAADLKRLRSLYLS